MMSSRQGHVVHSSRTRGDRPLGLFPLRIQRFVDIRVVCIIFAPQFVHQLAFLFVSVVPPDEPGRTKNQLNLSLAMALESHAVEVEELGRLFPTIRTWDCFETLLWWCTIGTIPLIPRWQIRVIRLLVNDTEGFSGPIRIRGQVSNHDLGD